MIHIICGAPGSGKSTYVSRVKTHRDMVFDLDMLWVAMTGLDMYEHPAHMMDMMMSIRYAILKVLSDARVDYNVWIISSAYKAMERQRLQDMSCGDVTVIDIGTMSCMRNISNDPRRKDKLHLWEPIVKRWYDKYEPRPGETVINEIELRNVVQPKTRREGRSNP